MIKHGSISVRRHRTFHLAIEGPDGHGKSTALEGAKALLEQAGLRVAVVHYTNRQDRFGKFITKLYYNDHNSYILRTILRYRPLQAALYGTLGKINLSRGLRQARAQGADVILADRSVLCGFASHIGRMPTWFIAAVESTHVPDAIAFLYMPVEEAAVRIKDRDRLGHEEDLESQMRFRDDYEIVLANPPRRLRNTSVRRIDAAQDRSALAATVANMAFEHFGIG